MKLYEIISLGTYLLSGLIPKKKNRWIFGAWFGSAVSDNSKSFFDYVKSTHPEIEIIWVTNDTTSAALENVTVVRRNTIQSLKYILTAQVAVCNQGFGDFCAFHMLGGCFKVQLWHGVAWKKIVRDALPNLSKLHMKVFQFLNRYDLYVAPSEAYEKVIKSAFGAEDDQIVLSGQPRNQVLFDEAFCKQCHDEILAKAGQKNQKIVAYMPTFRDKTDQVFSFCTEEAAREIAKLAKKYHFILVEKSHYKSAQRNPGQESEMKCVYKMPHLDAQTLLGAADILITDYSSCFFDYMIRNKPIIHFAYDYDYYKNQDRGLYYEIGEVAAGSVAYCQQDLFRAVEDNLISDVEHQRREKVREKFITYESPDSCKQIMEQIQKRIKQ